MTAYIFATPSRLFRPHEAATGGGSRAGQFYSIYTGKVGRAEATQLDHLRVAGKFCGALVRAGRTLNQLFAPQIYDALLAPPGVGPNDVPTRETERDTIGAARLAAFVQGIRMMVPKGTLINVAQDELWRYLHGIPFEEMPEWRPAVRVLVSQSTRAEQTESILQAYQNLPTKDVAGLWLLASGMQNIPLKELCAPEGLVLRESRSLAASSGFDFDQDSRIFTINRVQFGNGNSYMWKSVRTRLHSIMFAKYLLRRRPPAIRPKIAIPFRNGKELIDKLVPLSLENVKEFTVAELVAESGDPGPWSEYGLFFPVLNELWGSEARQGLFTVTRSADGMSLLDVDVARPVEDQEAHLRRLEFAGIMYAMAFQRSFHHLLPQPVPPITRLFAKDPGEGGRFVNGALKAARSAAFVAGLHRVVPAWAASYLLARDELTPSQFIQNHGRFSVPPSSSCDSPKQCLSTIQKIHSGLLRALSTLSQPQQQLFYLFLIGRPRLTIFDILANPPPPPRVLVSTDTRMVSISEGVITLPGDLSLRRLDSLIHQTLMPASLIRAMAGLCRDEELEPRTITALAGQLLPGLHALYQSIGLEQCKWGALPEHWDYPNGHVGPCCCSFATECAC